jgi:hypothetical protein
VPNHEIVPVAGLRAAMEAAGGLHELDGHHEYSTVFWSAGAICGGRYSGAEILALIDSPIFTEMVGSTRASGEREDVSRLTVVRITKGLSASLVNVA